VATGSDRTPDVALVHVEALFLGGWLILLFAGTVWASSLPVDGVTRRTVGCIGLAALTTTGATLILHASRQSLPRSPERRRL